MSVDSVEGFKALCGTFTGLTIISVGLRFIARKKTKLPLLADDWFILAALAFFLGTMVTVILLAHADFVGYASRPSDKNEANFILAQKAVFCFDLLIVWVLALSKASALFFYKRVFCPDRKHNRILHTVIWISLVLDVCWLITFFLLGLFQCGDHFNFGNDHFKYCGILNSYQLGFYISDVILDVWIMLLPIPYIASLRMRPVKKWSISIIFLLSFVYGCFLVTRSWIQLTKLSGLGASIARLVNHLQIPPAGLDKSHKSAKSGSAYTTYLWFGTLEMGATIVAINLPTLWGIFTKTTPEILLRISRSVTSLASRAFTNQNGSDSGSARQSTESQQESEFSKAPIYFANNGGHASVEHDRTSSVEDLPLNEIKVQESWQVISEKDGGKVQSGLEG